MSDIGGWPICVWYGILTVSDQILGLCSRATRSSRRGPLAVHEAQTGGSGSRFRSAD
jgi:hypothetical protein